MTFCTCPWIIILMFRFRGSVIIYIYFNITIIDNFCSFVYKNRISLRKKIVLLKVMQINNNNNN